MTNLILATDSYKQSHFLQYPPATKRVSAYVEARTNPFSDRVLFFGLQAFLGDYLTRPVTAADIDEAATICAAHGVPFNRAGWEIIVADHGGLLPIEISALAEGSVVPSSVPLVQVVNTDDRLPWLATWIETALLRGIWYPTTVATLSWMCKRVIYAGLVKSSDDPDGQVPFKLHDFGARGVSSGESAGLGGLAHLVNFMGTDTMEALIAAQRHYGPVDMPGFSIPAAEHSTITSWGRDREEDAYANMLTQFGGEGKIVAVVSDSYDLDRAVADIWGGSLSAKVRASGGTLVVRPDSGDPVTTPLRTVATLWDKFGGTTNSKGYRVLDPCVRVIQGDGMTIDSIGRLVDAMLADGWAIDNIAFGMGGGLLQHVNRDTLRFAMKANAMMDGDGVWHDVFKQPATDVGKSSKAGRQAVVDGDGVAAAVRLEALGDRANLLQPVYRDGRILRMDKLTAIKERAEAALKLALAG
jgi:nicotinamide phosphoribosyltransferase